ncbi:unnamed protein product, partial [Effrenium voratum]
MVAVPAGSASEGALASLSVDHSDGFLGPFTSVTVPATTEDLTGVEEETPQSVTLWLLDLSLSDRFHAFDPVTEGDLPGFHPEDNQLVPYSPSLLTAAHWVSSETGERLAFYSAASEAVPPQEEQTPPPRRQQPKPKRVTTASLADQLAKVVDMLPAISSQLQELQMRQDAVELRLEPAQASATVPALPTAPKAMHQQPFPAAAASSFQDHALGAVAKSLGPPPKTRPLAPSPSPSVGNRAEADPEAFAELPQGSVLRILADQSRALGILAAQLGAGDTLGDLAKVAQQAHRKMAPADPMPSSLQEASRTVSFTRYMEIYGGYQAAKEMGLMMWVLSHVANCMLREDHQGAQDHLGLLMVSIEQAVGDGGRWDLAYLLTLLDEPPQQVFASRPQPRLRAFMPLCPQPWATCALAFIKEVDIISTRRLEAAGTSGTSNRAPRPVDRTDPEKPAPKRKP